MAILRKLSAKLRTAISPASSPEPSPTAQTGSSFGVLSGRKEGGGISVTRPEQHMRSDSLMTYATNSSKETVEEGDKKPRRMSRFREELDADVWYQ